MSRPLIVTADDTTGALESAAAAADGGWNADVVPHSTAVSLIESILDDAGAAERCIVVDLRSRHATADDAGRLLASVLASARGRAGIHKIDSTLRGNWPAEIAAAVRSGRRVLMVPAYPAAGRTCRGGVVSEHDVPVDRSAHADDPRSPVLTSRPADLLDAADKLPTAADVAAWLTGTGRIGVADAVDDHHVAALTHMAVRHDDVLLVGTAGVVGAAARALAATRSLIRPSSVPPHLAAPILVVNGSLHPVSGEQIDALLHAGAGHSSSTDSIRRAVLVLSTPPDRQTNSAQVALGLASHAHEVVRIMRAATVVVVGGDTAEAFVGDRTVHVAGSLDVGVAMGSIDLDGSPIALVSKPGAFGSPNTLVNLMSAALNGQPRP